MDRIIFGLLLVAMGAVEALRPQFLWKYAHGGRKRHAQPTERELLISRIGGVVLLLVGVSWFFL